jgi:hypothetical protein
MHHGRIHPYYEEVAYSQWRHWHLQLEREEQHRRHRRGREFLTLSGELAWCYTELTKTRDLMYWQLASRFIRFFGHLGQEY